MVDYYVHRQNELHYSVAENTLTRYQTSSQISIDSLLVQNHDVVSALDHKKFFWE